MSEAVLPEPSEGGTPETGRIEGWRGAEDRFRAAMALAPRRPSMSGWPMPISLTGPWGSGL